MILFIYFIQTVNSSQLKVTADVNSSDITYIYFIFTHFVQLLHSCSSAPHDLLTDLNVSNHWDCDL